MENQKKTKHKEFPYLVYDQSDSVMAWVANRIPDVDGFGFENGKGIGVVSGGRLIAGSVYTSWFEKFGTIQWTLASISTMWARKEIIKGLLEYPFVQLNLHKVWITMASDNPKAIQAAKHVGFEQEAILPHQYGKGRDAVFCRMFRPDFIRLYGE